LEVDKIVAHDGSDLTGYRYLVKWKGYDDQYNTWEDQDNFIDWQCIRDYWADLSAGPGMSKTSGTNGKKLKQNVPRREGRGQPRRQE
jgi:hypothetical protein